jgi:small-conductance mechanosensitive channel
MTYVAAGYQFTESLQNGLDKLLGLIPAIIGFVLLIIIGWIFAKIARAVVRKLLRKLRFDRAITLSPAGKYVERVIEHPTDFLAKLAYWIVFLGFVLFAVSSLGVPALTLVVNGIYRYTPNVIAAILIFLVASAITAGAETFVAKVLGSGALAKLVGAIVPAIIMPIAIFMILDQLHIARNIVDITYAALVGAVALGLALAFGLGGRDVAGRILEQAYDNAQEKSGQLQGEYQQAKATTRGRAQNTRRHIDEQT